MEVVFADALKEEFNKNLEQSKKFSQVADVILTHLNDETYSQVVRSIITPHNVGTVVQIYENGTIKDFLDNYFPDKAFPSVYLRTYSELDEFMIFKSHFSNLYNKYNPELIKEIMIYKGIFDGHVSDVPCINCGRYTVFTFTAQRRSSDEGATNFFICLSCDKKWKINN